MKKRNFVPQKLAWPFSAARPKLPKVGPSWSLKIDEKRSQKAEEIGGFCLNVIFLGDILLMVQKSGSPVEGKVVYPIIYRVLAPSQVVCWISAINSITAFFWGTITGVICHVREISLFYWGNITKILMSLGDINVFCREIQGGDILCFIIHMMIPRYQ